MKIILLTIATVLFLIVVLKYLLKDFFLFIKIRSIFLFKTPSKNFVDYGEYLAHLIFLTGLAVLGMFCFKFMQAVPAYIFSSDLSAFFIQLRGVYDYQKNIQNPFELNHLLTGMALSPFLKFISIFIIYKGIRQYMLLINTNYTNTFSNERDILFISVIATTIFSFLEIFLYVQNLPVISLISHLTFVVFSSITSILFILGTHHLRLLRIEQYRKNLNDYFTLKDYEKKIIFSKIRFCTLIYVVAVLLQMPFYFGSQYLKNNGALIAIFLLTLAVCYVILKIFFSGVFNYLGIAMCVDNFKICQSRCNGKFARIEKIFFAIFILFAITKIKLAFVFLFFSVVGFGIIIILIIVSYAVGLLFSIIRFTNRLPNISFSAILNYVIILIKANLRAVVPMLVIIFVVFSMISLRPKVFIQTSKSFVHSIKDGYGRYLYIGKLNKPSSIPVSNYELPNYFKKELIRQEDRHFWNQESFFPNVSNWHGFSLATAYRYFISGTGGGSNINTELLKNLFFDNSAPRDLIRKFSENIASYQLSVQRKDSTIFNDYINVVPFGNSSIGAMAGSLSVFGKPIDSLNYLEQDYLINTLKRSNSFRTADSAILYKDVKLYYSEIKSKIIEDAESNLKNKLISMSEFDSLKKCQLHFIKKPFKIQNSASTNEFYLKQMKKYSNYDSSYNYSSAVKKINQNNIFNGVRNFEYKFRSSLNVGGCTLYYTTLMVDVKSGKILGFYSNSPVDLIEQRNGNPSGSLIKPIVLLQLLEEGFKNDEIKLLDDAIIGRQVPKNFNGKYSHKYVGIDEILGPSLNAPMKNIDVFLFNKTIDAIHLYKHVEDKFTQMNIKKDEYLFIEAKQKKQEIISNYPLGSRNLTVYDVAQVYQTILNNGLFEKLSMFDSVYNPFTNRMERIKGEEKQIYNRTNTDLIKQALTNPFQSRGTLNHLSLPKNGTYYGKSGTTSSYRFGWTVISDGNVVIVSMISYGTIINNQLQLGVRDVLNGSGGHSAGILCSMVYNEIIKSKSNEK